MSGRRGSSAVKVIVTKVTRSFNRGDARCTSVLWHGSVPGCFILLGRPEGGNGDAGQHVRGDEGNHGSDRARYRRGHRQGTDRWELVLRQRSGYRLGGQSQTRTKGLKPIG